MQLHFGQPTTANDLHKTDPTLPRAIESDDFPFEQISRISERESWRKEIHRPIYHVHKWWAQRLGSVFRGIILGAVMPKGSDVLELFYSPVRIPDTVVFDPFMGSGTTLGETLKLGGKAIGRDINPVSYFQVRTALTLRESSELERAYLSIEKDVAQEISRYYTTSLPDGTPCQVLYYFWVMRTPCPVCNVSVDLFSNYIFARHAYSQRNPTVRVICPKCGSLSSQHHQVRQMKCSGCGHCFDAACGPVKGKSAKCLNCLCEFTIGRAIRDTGSAPSYRMYAKLVLTPNGQKEYHPVSSDDEFLYQQAIIALEKSDYSIPTEGIEPGYNTNQVLNYGFHHWSQMFNARQLLSISMLANRLKEIEDASLRDAFTCLLSGVLEFNNMFASYKGEGTGAVRHMFYHHILKPERTPLEANIWGTPKSSGAFSTLFRSRLLRASRYSRQPFELALSPQDSSQRSYKVDGINESLAGITSSESYEHFEKNSRLYVSCGDSADTDLPDGCVDVVITDPPFFDNVHYSQLADFFYVWQKLITGNSPSHQAETTRSVAEVQNSDARTFTQRLTLVFQESARVLKDSGLLVFTYHHSRWEGWRSVLEAIRTSGFHITACHPVKSEMSVAAPKRQAKDPINFDIIMVCRKNPVGTDRRSDLSNLTLSLAFARAEEQIARLQSAGWEMSRNDIGIVVMAQAVREISSQPVEYDAEHLLVEAEDAIAQTIEQLHRRRE